MFPLVQLIQKRRMKMINQAQVMTLGALAALLLGGMVAQDTPRVYL